MAMNETARETDLLVIGGGPGGYSAAFRAAEHGIKTTIVDSDGELGGVCLHRGCIPSKTLLGVAETLAAAQHAQQMGVEFARPRIDVDGINRWKSKVITKLTRGLAAMARKLEVEVVRGKAVFDSDRHVSVSDREVSRIAFERAVIAAGSRPVTLRGIQIDSPRVMGSTGALRLESIPASVLVIGGGYIGLELGSVLDALGSKVTVVEMLPSLLAGCDPDLARPLIRRLEKAFEQISLETRVVGMKELAGGIAVSFEGENIPERKIYDHVLVAVGRRPNADVLGLDAAHIETDDRGFIKVDDRFGTSNPQVFAVGDIIGGSMLAHKAAHEGKAVADVLVGSDHSCSIGAIPAVVFTDPEIAWVGLTESEAAEKNIAIHVRKMQWVVSGRAAAMGRTDGLTKIIFDPHAQRVLGVGIVGVHAGEMIAEGALAIRMGAVAADLASTVRPHPTVSELMGDVAGLMLLTPGA